MKWERIRKALDPKLCSMRGFDYLELESDPQRFLWNHNMNEELVKIHKNCFNWAHILFHLFKRILL